MPIFSLPSDFGIGTLGRDACDFIDFLAAADVHVCEIMPICHTDSSFSPHNALCARAGNPLLIDLQPFVDQGVFSSRELSRMDWGRDRAKISYSKVQSFAGNIDWIDNTLTVAVYMFKSKCLKIHIFLCRQNAKETLI